LINLLITRKSMVMYTWARDALAIWVNLTTKGICSEDEEV
jgi:hypothetical protein